MKNFETYFAFTILFVFIFIFVKISLRLRKTGGTMTTTVHGALDNFYTKDKKKAAEMVVEIQAHKKLDEQSSAKEE